MGVSDQPVAARLTPLMAWQSLSSRDVTNYSFQIETRKGGIASSVV